MIRPSVNSVLRSFPIRLILALALVVGLPAAAGDPFAGNKARVYEMYAAYKAEAFPGARDLSARSLMELMASRYVVLVDVREPGEQAVSMLPGAVSADAYLADPARFAGALVVSYCTIGYRSGQLAERETAAGRPMLNIQAGLLGWVHEGGRVYDPAGRETRRIHVYGSDWNLPPAGFETVW